MAYDASKHKLFAAQMTNWFRTLQTLRTEAVRLDDIYVQEGESGGNAAFLATDEVTKQELIDGIVFMRTFKNLCEGGVVSDTNRVSNITPFLV